MSSVRFDILWSPTDEHHFIRYGTTIELYQVIQQAEINSFQSGKAIKISDETYAVNVATNSDIHFVKSVAWCPHLEPKHLLAVGQTNGRVVLTSFNNIGSPRSELIGKEFMHNVKHSRQCSYLCWNPLETSLLAEGFNEKYRNDPCVMVWDVTSSSEILTSRTSTTSEGGTITRPAYEIGSGTGDTSSSFSWFGDGKTLVTGMNNRQLRVYDLRDLTNPRLLSHHKSVYGVCVDSLGDRMLASFGENQVAIWDLRSFEKPILTLPEAKNVIKISWCPTRQGMLSVLVKDSNVIKMYDIRHSVFGSDVTEPVLIERNIQSFRQSVVSSFCWHPSQENRLLSVAFSGDLQDIKMYERIPLVWSPSFHLRSVSNKLLVEFCHDKSNHDNDISLEMFGRVQRHYGFYNDDLSQNIQAVEDKPHLHGLWRWLASVQCFSGNGSRAIAMAGDMKPVSNSCVGIKGLLNLKNCDSEPCSDLTYGTWQGLEGMSSSPSLLNQYVSKERSRALQLCGWVTDEDQLVSLDQLLKQLQADHLYEKAAALALFNLRMKQALEILGNGADTHKGNKNLNAVAMALAGYTDEKNALWQKTCNNLRLQLTHPYLRAMFAFLVGERDSYKDVLHERGMAVQDRIAFACKYLTDKKLYDFIEEITTELKQAGDLDGLLVTGMTNDGLDLLQQYVDNTCDIQTAALAMVYSLPNEISKDIRCTTWIQSYRELLDMWGLWHDRARFDIIHQARDSTLRVPAQVFVSCNFCANHITSTTKTIARSRSYMGRGIHYKPKITCCPNCRKSLPRCALCLTNLGTASGTGIGQEKSSTDPDSKLSIFQDWFTWCQTCRHGGHSSHITQWFSQHSECPVTGCACKCMSLDAFGRV
ncbi:GATOR complex protein MIOS-like [Gigantopelta aegis]|uniref:GATOR complex protein MIOS-like n=1 Tax=Gigantopelta aegis TaxID=1735272 RepID=UPI001B887F99|nr:GATOR complex protein MIOS-like [Gigantopelta aegis]